MPLCNTLISFLPAHTQNRHFAHKQETSSVCPLVDFQPHPRNNQYDQNNAPSFSIITFLQFFSNSFLAFISFSQSNCIGFLCCFIPYLLFYSFLLNFSLVFILYIFFYFFPDFFMNFFYRFYFIIFYTFNFFPIIFRSQFNCGIIAIF